VGKIMVSIGIGEIDQGSSFTIPLLFDGPNFTHGKKNLCRPSLKTMTMIFGKLSPIETSLIL